MLEKEAGNIDIDKLRAICLFQADLNWVLNKVIYAKRMMANARENDLVPPELFTTTGQSAPNATMAKVMFTDLCRTYHRNHAVASVDIGQCYNVVAHRFFSLALHAFRVPMKAIKLMLLTLQTMNFWLRTAYDEDKTAKTYSLNENLTFLLRCLLPTFLAPKDRESERDFLLWSPRGGLTFSLRSFLFRSTARLSPTRS